MKIFSKILVIALFMSLVAPAQAANVTAGSKCPKAGKKEVSQNKTYTCIKLGSKLYWDNGKPVKTSASTSSLTVSQSNAVKKAKSYLSYSSFSRSGLIKQLEFEGFSNADSIIGVDAQKADWKVQASKKGKSYLSTSSFSLTGLIKQLEFEGFSTAEAEFGVAAQKADWNAQAAKKAKSYLSTSSFSRSGLLDQLEFEGFTPEQAEFGVKSTGL
jgi:hypothetical protein